MLNKEVLYSLADISIIPAITTDIRSRSECNPRQPDIEGSPGSLLLPVIVSPFFIILTKTFVEGIPGELSEAAELDGAGVLKTFFHVMLPVMKPIMATIAIFAAVNQWNAFQDTLLLVTETRLYSLQFLLYQYLNQASSLSSLANNSSSSSLAAAAATMQTATSIRMTITVIVVIPIMLVYPIFQRYFVKGIMIGAVKG